MARTIDPFLGRRGERTGCGQRVGARQVVRTAVCGDSAALHQRAACGTDWLAGGCARPCGRPGACCSAQGVRAPMDDFKSGEARWSFANAACGTVPTFPWRVPDGVPGTMAAEAGGPDSSVALVPGTPSGTDRKSTRLNSSHANISHSDFCFIRASSLMKPLPLVSP